MLANVTQVEEILKRLLVAANGGKDPELDVNIKMPQLVRDFANFVENLSTKRNAKVLLIFILFSVSVIINEILC